MKIAILHYHLRTGGVTSVMRRQVEALKSHCRVMLLSGEPPVSEMDVPVACVPELAYDTVRPMRALPEKTANAVIHAMVRTFGTVADVLHVHNPLLAKNKDFLTVLKQLREKGIHLLLQLHDFAEDGRPHVYFRDAYPDNCHYGVINARDYAALLASGANPEGLHIIENAIKPLFVSPLSVSPDQFVLYPVRAIRRKNIGEALLLTLFFKNHESLWITQPPNSDEDMRSRRDWMDFVKAHGFNVLFDVGVKQDFAQLVAKSQYFITTSIAEGFGFSFLEPWTADKFLVGRLLPGICSDFEANHVMLDHLYPALKVPVAWIDKSDFRRKWTTCMHQALLQFGVTDDFINLSDLFNRMVVDDTIDFGLLDEFFQRKLIQKVQSSDENKKVLMTMNPFLSRLDGDFDIKKIEANKKAICDHYNLKTYRQTLLEVYGRAAHDQVFHAIDRSALLKQFVIPGNASLLKWGRYGQ